MEHNLWKIFEAVAATVGDRDAIVWRDRRIAFRDLHARANRLANVLAAHGLGAHSARADLQPWEIGQDTVGLYLLNGPEYLEATFGGFAARTAPFNINYRYVAEELAYLLDDAGPAAIVYHSRFAPTLAEALPRLRQRPTLLLQVADDSGAPLLPGAIDYEVALAGASTEPVARDHSPDDIYLLYTGGTTGMPKGVLWRHADIWPTYLARDSVPDGADLDTITGIARSGGDDRVLATAPFMHGAGHVGACGALLLGRTVVIPGVVDRLDPADYWAVADRERATITTWVGEAFARPLVAELETGCHDAASLRIIISGGAVLSEETRRRALKALPQVVFVELAGSSESGPGLRQVSTSDGPVPDRGVFAAEPVVAVLDEQRRQRLEPGHDGPGWFAYSGRIPLGYLGDPAKTQATFLEIDGVRYSVPGDRVRLRHDGLVEFLGRESVTINSGGEKVFAEEVEAALLGHPAVADTIVVGRPSERWGEEVVAIVKVAGGTNPSDAELLAVASERVARFKLPKAIVRVDNVVRSPAGKADYGWAREVARAANRREVPT